MKEDSTFEYWEQLRSDPNLDPLEVLRAVRQFRLYFAAVEREAVKLARSSGRSWQDIGEASGRTRQAAWQQAQRAGQRALDHRRANEGWQAIRDDPKGWIEKTAPLGAVQASP